MRRKELHRKRVLDWWHSGGDTPVTPDPGLVWLQENAYVFHDYTRIASGIEETIALDDDGLLDVGPNGINGTALNSIAAANWVYNNTPVGALKDLNDDCVSITISEILTYLRLDHRVSIILQTDDGQTAAVYSLFGATTNNTSGARQKYGAFINGTGNIVINMGVGGGQINWTSTSAVIPNGSTGLIEIIIDFNFTADTLTVTKYDYNTSTASNVAGSFATGGDNINISAVNPANLNLTHNFYIGSINNAGTATTNAQIVRIFRFCVTPLSPLADAVTYLRDLTYDGLWEARIHVTSGNASTTREALIDVVFPEGTLPANATPDSITAINTGTEDWHGVAFTTLGTTFSGATRYTFVRDDVSNKIIRINPSAASNNKAFFWTFGHSPISDDVAVKLFLQNGYTVFVGASPATGDAGDVSENTVGVSGPWTPSGAANNHNEMNTLGTDGLQYFFFDKIEMMNYAKANLSFTNYYIAGVSDGGWHTLWLAALDERFEKAFPKRGFNDRIFWCGGNLSSTTFQPDYEQQGANGLSANCGAAMYALNSLYTQLDLVALGTTGGRLVKIITHRDDPSGSGQFGGLTYNTWVPRLNTLAGQISSGGEVKNYLSTTIGEEAHSVYASEVAEILNELP
jgi:hypothetical protein